MPKGQHFGVYRVIFNLQNDAFSDVSCETLFCKPYDIVGSKNKPCENENGHYFSDTSN